MQISKRLFVPCAERETSRYYLETIPTDASRGTFLLLIVEISMSLDLHHQLNFIKLIFRPPSIAHGAAVATCFIYYQKRLS